MIYHVKSVLKLDFFRVIVYCIGRSIDLVAPNNWAEVNKIMINSEKSNIRLGYNIKEEKVPQVNSC